MTGTIQLFFFACVLGYGTVAALYALGYTLGRGNAPTWAWRALAATAAVHGLVLLLHGVEVGHLPLGGAESVGAWDHPFPTLAWLLAVVAAGAGLFRPATRILGAFVAPIIFGLVLGGLLVADPDDVSTLLPDAMASAWIRMHTLSIYVSVGLFALAFGSGIAYLSQDRALRKKQLPGQGRLRLPPLGVLDSINHWGFAAGLIGLSIGIATGTFFAISGGANGVDLRPKVVATLGLWMLYALGWQARFMLGWGGRKAAWVAIVGFVGLIASAVGIGHA